MTLAKSAALQIYSEDSQRGLDLPEDWAFPKIGEILAVNYGKGLKKAKRVPGPVSVYGSNGVVGKHNIPLTHGPTIILGRKGTVGAVHFSKVPCWPIDTTYFIDEFNGLAPRYLVYALRRLNLSQLDTSTAIPGLNRDELYSQYVPLAPLAEQKRIVAKVEQLLSRVNAARERLAKVPEILKRFRQSVLAAACSGRLTADWRDGRLDLRPAIENLKRVLANRRTEWKAVQPGKMRAAGKLPKNNRWKAKYKQPASPRLGDLPELPAFWCWATVEQLASASPRSIQSGPFGSNLLHSEFQAKGILAIGIDNVLDGKFFIGREHRISNQKYQELKKYTLTLQKSRMPQIQDVEGEAVVVYCEPLTTQEMRYHRLSRRVNNMAGFSLFIDLTLGGFVNNAS